MSPKNQDFVPFEEIPPFQNAPETLSLSTSLNLRYPYESTPGIPLDEFLYKNTPPVDEWARPCAIYSASGLLSPPIPPPQAMTFPSPQVTTSPLPQTITLHSQDTTFLPPNWRKIPQKAYNYGQKQWNFTQLEPIHFSVNGRRGINMGDALRKMFTGLDGRDDLVLQDASSAISCRLLVCSPRYLSPRARTDEAISSSPGTHLTVHPR